MTTVSLIFNAKTKDLAYVGLPSISMYAPADRRMLEFEYSISVKERALLSHF